MNTGDVVALISILVIVGLASLYIIVSKKKGKKCIGCPYLLHKIKGKQVIMTTCENPGAETDRVIHVENGKFRQ